MTNHDNTELFATLLGASIHEIKNRFGLLYNNLDTLVSETNAAQSPRAQAIKSEAEFISSELMRVLTTYKSLQDGFNVMMHQQFAEDFIEEVIARHNYTIEANKLTVNYECEDDANAHFDLGLVTTVFDTLLYNAIKAGATELFIEGHDDYRYLYLALHDNGPGFPAHMLTTNSDNNSDEAIGETSHEAMTTGLGLHFAKRLLASHQEGDRSGHLVLSRSNKLSGACATIALPL